MTRSFVSFFQAGSGPSSFSGARWLPKWFSGRRQPGGLAVGEHSRPAPDALDALDREITRIRLQSRHWLM